jgi:anti-anti-sigma regulatory factor
MWIDVERAPVVVRLAGTLSKVTAARLVSVVAELVADGCHDFAMQTRDLEVSDTAGAEALMDLQRLITRSGGRVGWDAPTIVSG